MMKMLVLVLGFLCVVPADARSRPHTAPRGKKGATRQTLPRQSAPAASRTPARAAPLKPCVGAEEILIRVDAPSTPQLEFDVHEIPPAEQFPSPEGE